MEQPFVLNVDEFSRPMKAKPLPIPPHVSRSRREREQRRIGRIAKRREKERADERKEKVLPPPSNTFVGLETKAKRVLRIEP